MRSALPDTGALESSGVKVRHFLGFMGGDEHGLEVFGRGICLAQLMRTTQHLKGYPRPPTSHPLSARKTKQVNFSSWPFSSLMVARP